MMIVRPPKRRDLVAGLVRGFIARIASRGIRRVSSFIIVFWLFSNVFPKVLSASGESVEYSIKLAFLYNFGKFVEWPPDAYRSADSPMAICIVGREPFSPAVEGELATRTVGGHPVKVLTLKTTDKLTVCHMVFIPVTEKGQAEKIVRSLMGSSTLTIGETEGFTVMGGVINLTVDENKVQFEVNQLAARRSGLKISSKLLSLAKTVTDNAHEPSR
jgi:hypothetical protein